MKKSLTERIKALPTFLKGDAIKKYGYSFIGIVLCMLIIAYVMNICVGIVLTLFVILIGILLYSFADYIIKETNHYISNLSYKINKGSQDASIKMPIGMLLLDSNSEIQWINPYLQKYFDKNDTGFEKVFFKAPSSGEKQSGKIVWMDIFLGVCMVGLIGISVCLKD